MAPSAIKVDQFPEMPAELTVDEIGKIVAAFGIMGTPYLITTVIV